MKTVREGTLRIHVPEGISIKRFDGEQHGLCHCMKAVDFILDVGESYIFLEIKDPWPERSRGKSSQSWVKKFLSGSIDEDLKYKYRDSFLYAWASEQAGKPIDYYVLVAIDTLSEAELLHRTDELKRKLPVEGPKTGIWKRRIVRRCVVFNLSTWNRIMKDYPIDRVMD